MEPYSDRDDPNVPLFDDTHSVIVFDGRCALCSGWVDFAVARDGVRNRFVAAQRELGEALYAHNGLKSGDDDTYILIKGGQIKRGQARTESDSLLAMLKRLAMLKGLEAPWALARLLRIVPERLRIWGRRDGCRVAGPGERARFL